MAKLYRTNSQFHPQCYALQQSEDVIVAAAYLDLQADAPQTIRHTTVLSALELHWLRGQGLSDRTLISLNDLRRVNGQREIRFIDSHSSTYSLLRGEEKATQRGRILESLRRLRVETPSRYTDVLERAQAVAKSLPARDPLQFVA